MHDIPSTPTEKPFQLNEKAYCHRRSLTNSVPQGAIRRNPTGIESEPELLRTIINEQCLPEGHSTMS